MGAGRQTNIALNRDRDLAFFEGEDICFNYKTGQWTAVPAYDGLQYYGVDRKGTTLGLIRESSGSYQFQEQTTSGVAQAVVLETGDTDLNPTGRAFVKAVRPIHDGGTASVRIGYRDNLTDAVSYTTATAINSRTRQADFRNDARYHRVELTITGTAETVMGYEVEFEPSGLA